MNSQIVCALFFLVATVPLNADEPDLLIADFEGDTYGGWKTTGDAFGPGPARGTLPNQMHVDGFEGKGLVNSFFNEDGTTGTLTSPEFTIERKFINFLIGGGRHDGKTCINLLVDGKVARTATGPNDRPGGTERLDWKAWDVSDLRGKKASLEIVDTATGGWGHINVDHILQSNVRRGTQQTLRELEIDKDYLLLPVKNGATMRRMKLLVGSQVVREFEIELAERDADFVVSADVRAFHGKTIVVETQLPIDSISLTTLELSDNPPSASGDESKRPKFHFTSRRGWLNDPNGLVYYKDEWHLFYQHNPYGWNWGNMHWGHAVSSDLLHWQELPTAIHPRQWGDWAFSGSAVVDAKNTSGFKTGREDVLVAAYTSTGRGECMAFSNDRGRTWTDYERNPVVKHAGRDPKIIWHEPTARWVMAVYDEPPGQERAIAFYSSPDLKVWTYTSRIDGFYECPDLFPLAVDGDANRQKWVLYGADGKYLVGNFDGKAFHGEAIKHQVWYGNFYAAQTFSDVPDSRRIQIGWANGITFPGQPFNQQMTIPVELTLRATDKGTRMFAWPVKELEASQQGRGVATRLTIDHLELQPGQEVTVSSPSAKLDLFDLKCELELKQAEKITLTVCGMPIVYDTKSQTLTCRNVSAPVALKNEKLGIRVVGDRGSLEVFANSGEVAISVGYMPSDLDRSFKAKADGGAATLHQPSIGDVGDPPGSR